MSNIILQDSVKQSLRDCRIRANPHHGELAADRTVYHIGTEGHRLAHRISNPLIALYVKSYVTMCLMWLTKTQVLVRSHFLVDFVPPSCAWVLCIPRLRALVVPVAAVSEPLQFCH